MAKRVTIQDIADELGISRNTVSKAINNNEGVAEETRERILRKAANMGYKQFSYLNLLSSPSLEADTRPQAAGKPAEIAVLTGKFLYYSHFASPMLDRFQHEISTLGYTMRMHQILPENLKNGTLPSTFQTKQAAGVVCIEVFARRYAEMICTLGLPVLFIDSPVVFGGAPLPADQLYMENTVEVARITSELLRRGKTRIGFVGDYTHCQSFFERYLAFRSAMMLHGVPVDETLCIKDPEFEIIHRRIYSMDPLPDAFLCANDFIAIDVLDALRKMGKSVPEDVLLCGFDDSPESRRMIPPLTTIHIHTQIMAFSAVQLLFSRIKEPNLDYRIVHTQTDLIRRESTGWKQE